MADQPPTFEQIIETLREGVFISHIIPEKAIALVLQRHIKAACGEELSVFVASDQTSIEGGREWFDHILRNLNTSRIILVLVSQESCGNAWVNFESGFCRGLKSTVVPIAIRDFTFDKLKFPLAGFQGRYIADIEGILLAIEKATGKVSDAFDSIAYKEEVLAAEASVTYKSVIVTPYLSPGEALKFTIENRGNTDIDLLQLSAWVPVELLPTNWVKRMVPNVLQFEPCTINGKSHWHCLYSSSTAASSTDIHSLRPVLTRSMGRILPAYPAFPMVFPTVTINDWKEGPPHLRDLHIYYQLHARNYDTIRESMRIGDVNVLQAN
jgi:hypothetical protein